MGRGGALTIAGSILSAAVYFASAKRRLARSERAGELAEERFRALFETAPIARLVVDAAGQITLVNAQTELMFGRSRDQLVGTSVEHLIPARHDDSGAWYVDALERVAGYGSLELTAHRVDRSAFPVEVSLTPLASERGRLLSVAVTDITERKLAAEALARRASHDPLTGLPNRTLFLDRLEHALARARRSQRRLAVMFLDLDDFKLVNDTRGHEVGDQLLVSLTPKLVAALRPGDTIARFGGDEFVVLCEDLVDDDAAIEVAKRIADACSGPIAIEGSEHVVTVSTGVVLVSEPAEATPSGILRDADAAMYRAKEGGKGRIEVFDESMRDRLVRRIAIEASLRRAIRQGELRLFYQPVMSIDSGRVVAMEALLRWQHPHRGLLEPSCFMNVAESTGLMLQIGEWVIEEACRAAASWHEATADAEPVRVSVNLSPRQIARSDIATTVARILRETGLDPGMLELEITETMLFEDAPACIRALRKLKELGVRLVLDDFGTGYSSFGYLKHFEIDALKIDRSFIGDLAADGRDGAMIGAVLGMAGALDVAVTAEGVETSEQLAELRNRGCEFAQGYLLSRPIPAEGVVELLELGTGRERLAA
jgi:diguanylate cyclase (GGDEF)-like protein/PAS domain S-box-containing protein